MPHLLVRLKQQARIFVKDKMHNTSYWKKKNYCFRLSVQPVNKQKDKWKPQLILQPHFSHWFQSCPLSFLDQNRWPEGKWGWLGLLAQHTSRKSANGRHHGDKAAHPKERRGKSVRNHPAEWGLLRMPASSSLLSPIQRQPFHPSTHKHEIIRKTWRKMMKFGYFVFSYEYSP